MTYEIRVLRALGFSYERSMEENHKMFFLVGKSVPRMVSTKTSFI